MHEDATVVCGWFGCIAGNVTAIDFYRKRSVEGPNLWIAIEFGCFIQNVRTKPKLHLHTKLMPHPIIPYKCVVFNISIMSVKEWI